MILSSNYFTVLVRQDQNFGYLTDLIDRLKAIKEGPDFNAFEISTVTDQLPTVRTIY